jgi:Ser-tRNA(Ala) deacylase AlaX
VAAGKSKVTLRQFWLEPYCDRFTTRIARTDGELVWLEESIFFAQSGGQESDSGTIAGVPVVNAAQVDGDLQYLMPGNHGLKAGQAVEVVIDWPRRYALMRLHFAAEIVLEVAMRDFGLTEKIGAHIAAHKARIDFLYPEPVTTLLPGILAQAQQVIDRDCVIVSDWQDRKSEKRFWRIEGFASVACGGTHLRRTSEVGQLALSRKNLGRGKERIEITARAPATVARSRGDAVS